MDWRAAIVSPDRTHHLVQGAPAYGERYQEVLKFHAPGLAPALSVAGAMHIDVTGKPAYSARFLRTFGFYEGYAAVSAQDGWHHVTPDGAPLYPERYAWCGNFQGGRCAVRHLLGHYQHLRTDGRALSEDRWRYAGDFRDGVAVVQREDGLHTHICDDGRLLHSRWFLDLDVFHKAFARARDAGGWTHVDEAGTPLYDRRFAHVEPFYNGQARVEFVDGSLEVVDERGETQVVLRPGLVSAFASLSADLVGHWRTDAIAGAVALGLFEQLPGTTSEIAGELGLQADRLSALLGALGELQLVQVVRGAWSLTERGALLRRDHPLTLADAALEYAGPLRQLWADLPAAVRPGWRGPDVFGDVAADPVRAVSHHRVLRSYARHDYPALPNLFALRGDERVLDVGGGVGVLAEALLAHQPTLRVTVLDRPEVTAQLPAGVTPLAADLFGAWGVTADVVVLARVLHDWDDDRAAQILEEARRTLPSGGRLFVVELLRAADGGYGGLCDLHLLLATGGRERTAEAYLEMLDRAGFDVVRIHPLTTVPSVIEAVAR